MSKRAPIYARVSTKDQKDCGYSLPTQIEACAAYATERGYMLVGEPFQDDYTGMSMDRPALNKLREAIPAAHIDVVIVLDLDRLARKAVYQMLLEEEFAKLGAVVEYANERYEDTDEGRFQKHIKAAVVEYERAKILERMKRDKAGRSRAGRCSPDNARRVAIAARATCLPWTRQRPKSSNSYMRGTQGRST